jgi:hypothetical protein
MKVILAAHFLPLTYVSKIPKTVTLLRFSLKAALLFGKNQMEKGLELSKRTPEGRSF